MMVAMWVFWIVALVGLVWLGVWLAGQLQGRGGGPQAPLEALQARYAAGAITREEYESVRADILRDTPTGSAAPGPSGPLPALSIVLLVLVILALIASLGMWSYGWMGRGVGARGMGGMMRGWNPRGAPTSFTSNGERIYFTGTDESGQPIAFTGGPPWLLMHGGGCVDCHGPYGRGGAYVAMTGVRAPDIRYATLTSAKPRGGEGEAQKPHYTDATIKRAITQGIDEAGHPLDPAMPRWHMSARDLNDVVAYLKVVGTPQGGRR